MGMTAEQALKRLKEGNAAYMQASANTGDISPQRVAQLSAEGQAPYACIVTCADSRIVPEHIFMAGLGELFSIRVAGNVIGPMVLASCVYAAEHLGVKLVVVLGHTQCGAIASALDVAAAAQDAPGESALSPLLSAVADKLGGLRDPREASIANARAGAALVSSSPEIAHLIKAEGLEVRPALYLTETGEIDWLGL